MIGRISGKLLAVLPPQILVDVNGLGYEVSLPIADCANLPSINEMVTLCTHLVVREDAHSLYGFLTADSRDCFRTLIKVSGIGPKIALALLSTLNPQELEIALENADVTCLSRTPGIGKKMAERMILELKGKLAFQYHMAAEAGNHSSGNSHIRMDIANALASLGYNDKEITKTMHQLPLDITNVSLGIKEALRNINK